MLLSNKVQLESLKLSMMASIQSPPIWNEGNSDAVLSTMR
jgi:hypothetical protein